MEQLRGDRGSVSAEVVIVVPTLMLLILVSVQFGLWYHASSVARAAAQEGVAAARIDGATAHAGQSEAAGFLAQAGSAILEDVQVAASRTADVARVDVYGTAVSIIPGFRLTVHGAAESPVERFHSPIEP